MHGKIRTRSVTSSKAKNFVEVGDVTVTRAKSRLKRDGLVAMATTDPMNLYLCTNIICIIIIKLLLFSRTVTKFTFKLHNETYN